MVSVAPDSTMALLNRPFAWGGAGHQGQCFGTSAGLPKQGHIVRISSECPDLGLNPLQRHNDVSQADIAGISVFFAV